MIHTCAKQHEDYPAIKGTDRENFQKLVQDI